MGPTLPPQRKGIVPPHYNRATLVELKDKFVELEVVGVFAKPELNPPPDISTTPPVLIPDPPTDTPPPAAEAPLMQDKS